MSTLIDASPSPAETHANESKAESVAVVSENTAKKTFTVEEIHALLPHRYPFALVDRIIDYVPGKSAVGIKNISFNEPQFQGHFPGRPIMPGVMMVEALAQVGGVVLTQMPEMDKGLFTFAGIDGVRFRRPVVPGDRLVMKVEVLWVKRGRYAKIHGEAHVDGQLAVEGDLTFSVLND